MAVADQVITAPSTRIVYRGLALLLLVALVLALQDFPYARIQLAIGLGCYMLLLWWQPMAWLVVLPVLIPTLNLAPWSGRLLCDEFDFFLAATLLVIWLRGDYSFAYLRYLPSVVRWLFVGLFCIQVIGLLRGFYPWTAFDANALSTYMTPYNALRAAKGFFWATLFAPILIRECACQGPQVRRLFAMGMTAAIACLAAIVFWERGIIRDFALAEDKYALLGNLLDFSSTYRVTGLFSDMHVGGAAIDGFVALTWPFCIWVIMQARRPWARGLAVLTLVLSWYVAVVTFSRATYLAILVGGLVWAVLMLRDAASRGEKTMVMRLLAGLMVATGMAFLAFNRGGTLALASLLVGLGGVVIVAIWLRGRLTAWLYAMLFIMVAWAIGYAMVTSRWVENNLPTAVTVALLLSLAMVWLGSGLVRWTAGLAPPQRIVTTMIPIIAIIGLLVHSLAGYRMDTRFSVVTDDVAHRWGHWEAVLDAMGGDMVDRLLGRGAGRFPADYALHESDNKGARSHYYLQEGDNIYVRVGGASDLMLGQRLSIRPDSTYRIAVSVRSEHPRSYVALRFCYKNIIYADDYNPTCRVVSVPFDKGVGNWKRGEAEFNSEGFGAEPWLYRWPMVLLLANPDDQWALDIDDIVITSGAEGNVVLNGDFQSGGDRWLAYHDFSHLAWHIKNLWLNQYYEYGLVGLVLALTWVIAIFAILVRGLTVHHADVPVLLASLTGFLTVGLFDSLIDAPRLSYLFFVLLWLALATVVTKFSPEVG